METNVAANNKCPRCGSDLVRDRKGTVCSFCGWVKPGTESSDGRGGSIVSGWGGVGGGEGKTKRKSSRRLQIFDADYGEDREQVFEVRRWAFGVRPIELPEISPLAAAAISLGAGFLAGFLWYFGWLIAEYVPALLYQLVILVLAVPVCWFFGGALLEERKRIRAAFACALAFSFAYAFTGWGIFAIVREGEHMAAQAAAVYAFMWSVSFAIVGAAAARAVGGYAAVTGVGPWYLAVVGVLGAVIGLGIELGFSHLFGGVLFGYIPSALTMAALLLGAAQTGMTHAR